MKEKIFILLQLFLAFRAFGQCENRCLILDGGDKISISNTSLLSITNFTIEAWVQADASYPLSGSLATLFEFKDFGPPGNNISLKFNSSRNLLAYYGPLQLTTIFLTSGWHHVALTNDGTQLAIIIDGINISSINVSLLSNFLSKELVIGKNLSNNEGWKGKIDEIRIWNYARTSAQILSGFHCVCNPSEPNLIIWMPLDQGIAGGSNSGLVAFDQSPLSGITNGVLTGFALSGSTSNIVCSNNLNLDYPNYQNAQIKFYDYSNPSVQVSQICSGEPLFFKLIMSDGTLADFPNVLVSGSPLTAQFTWQEYDGTTMIWNNISSFSTSGFAFPVAPNILTSNCSSNAVGFAIRKFRVKVELVDPITNSICSYQTLESELKICCPLSDFNIGFTTNDPDNLFCAGQPINFQANIISPDPFVNQLASSINIRWKINGVVNTSFNNLLNINLTGIASSPNVCIEAEITNCTCLSKTNIICIDVDPKPQCIGGNIKVLPASQVTLVAPNSYTICPNTSLQLSLDPPPPANFIDGIVQWEYSLNMPTPTWNSLGTSNPVQNTNILPQLSPPNPMISPYLWPAGQTCIYYRVKVLPLHNPSACNSCVSDIVKICLKPALAPISITGQNMICEGAQTTFSVTPYNPTITYNWFFNGVFLSSGPSIIAQADGNYWVEASSGANCTIVKSPIDTLMICKIEPKINCPPCVKLGNPVMLDACSSKDRCNKILSYNWSASNGSPLSGSSCKFTHTMPAAGTTYTLTVTNSMGCSATKVITLKPCP